MPSSSVRAESHGQGGSLERILRITHACNQRCAFCFVPADGFKDDPAGIEAELDRLAQELGAHGVLTLSGGEPLVHPRLTRILESARRRGISRFVLQTNAIGLDKPGALERLVGLGVTGFDVSFHSHLPRLYDRLTGTRGQHPRAVAALSRILSEPGVRVSVCAVINSLNYRHLAGWAGFLARLCRAAARGPSSEPILIGFNMLNSVGISRVPEWAVDLELVRPYLRRAMARCSREGLLVPRSTGEGDLPPCMAESPEDFASLEDQSQDHIRYSEDFFGDLGGIGSAKSPSCRKCPFDSKCLGVPAEYARRFGVGALRIR